MDSASASPASLSVRRCSGLPGKSCGQFMAPLDLDNHPVCTRCTGKLCTPEAPCSICLDWSEQTWVKVKARRSHKRSRSSSDRPSDFSSLTRRIDAMQGPLAAIPLLQANLDEVLGFIRNLAPQTTSPQFTPDVSKMAASVLLPGNLPPLQEISPDGIGQFAAVQPTVGQLRQLPSPASRASAGDVLLSTLPSPDRIPSAQPCKGTPLKDETVEVCVSSAAGVSTPRALPGLRSSDLEFFEPGPLPPSKLLQSPDPGVSQRASGGARPKILNQGTSERSRSSVRSSSSGDQPIISRSGAGRDTDAARDKDRLSRSLRRLSTEERGVGVKQSPRDLQDRGERGTRDRGDTVRDRGVLPDEEDRRDRGERGDRGDRGDRGERGARGAADVHQPHSSSRERSHSRNSGPSFVAAEASTTSKKIAIRTSEPQVSRREDVDFFSLNDEQQREMSFKQAQNWTQQSFPRSIPTFKPPDRKTSSFSELQSGSTQHRPPLLLLPWCDGILDTRKDVQKDLGVKGSFRSATRLPSPAGHMSLYGILDHPRAEEPVPVNPELSLLSTEPTKPLRPSFLAVDDDLRMFEASCRRSLMVQSTMDWHMATCAKFLSDLSTGVDNGADTSQGLEAIRRVLLSVSRSVSQLTRESSAALANTVLLRRDAYLRALPRQVSDQTKDDLRSTDVFSTSLFDDKTLSSAKDKMRKDAAHASHLKLNKISLESSSSLKPHSKTENPRRYPVYETDIPSSSYKTSRKTSSSSSSTRDKRQDSRPEEERKVFSKGSPRGRGRGGSSADAV